jgi:hypothetical protein
MNKNNKKISGQLEKKVAKQLGGRVTAGSGCFSFDPCDIQYKNYSIEHKFTRNDYFFLTKKIIEKNELESFREGKYPIIIVQFISDYGNVVNTCVIKKADENRENIQHIKRIRLNKDDKIDKSLFYTFDNNKVYEVINFEYFLNYLKIENEID